MAHAFTAERLPAPAANSWTLAWSARLFSAPRKMARVIR